MSWLKRSWLVFLVSMVWVCGVSYPVFKVEAADPATRTSATQSDGAEQAQKVGSRLADKVKTQVEALAHRAYNACLLAAPDQDYSRCPITGWAELTIPKGLPLEGASEVSITFERPLVTRPEVTVVCPVRPAKPVAKRAGGLTVICGPNAKMTAFFRPEGTAARLLKEVVVSTTFSRPQKRRFWDYARSLGAPETSEESHAPENPEESKKSARKPWSWAKLRRVASRSYVEFRMNGRAVTQAVTLYKEANTQPWRVLLHPRFSAARSSQPSDDAPFRDCVEHGRSLADFLACDALASGVLRVPEAVKSSANEVTITLGRPLLASVTSFMCPANLAKPIIRWAPGAAVICAPGPTFGVIVRPQGELKDLLVRGLGLGRAPRGPAGPGGGIRIYVEVRWEGESRLVEMQVALIDRYGPDALVFSPRRVFDLSTSVVPSP